MTNYLSNLEIVAFDEKIIDSAAALYALVFKSPPWNEDWSLSVAERRLNEMLQFPNYMGFAAINPLSHAILAFGLGWFETWHNGRLFQIRELCVHPDWQNKGLGRKLLNKIEKEVFRFEAIEIYLSTSREADAYRFYARNGYVDSPCDILMRKRKTA